MTEGPRDLPDFTRAYLLIGQDSDGNPVPVLVDDDGQFVALLQGQVAGVKTTISVDANGRLEAFVLDDESQWGSIVKTGNSELAARLGSPSTYDWRGQVLYCNTFADGLVFARVRESGTGAEVVVDPTKAMFGGYSAKMTGGSTTPWLADIYYYVTYSPSLVMGIQSAFFCGQPNGDFQITIVRDNGVTVYTAVLEVDIANGDLNYWTTGGTWAKLADVSLVSAAYAFYHVKMVVDFSTGKYVRALFGDVEYDMSALDCAGSASGGLKLQYCSVRVNSRAGNNDYFYTDHVLLTVDEPT